MVKLCNRLFITFKLELFFRNDKTCITGNEDATVISEIIANLSKYNLTTETSVEQYWELVETYLFANNFS